MGGLLCHVIFGLIMCVNGLKDNVAKWGFRGYFCEKMVIVQVFVNL